MLDPKIVKRGINIYQEDISNGRNNIGERCYFNCLQSTEISVLIDDRIAVNLYCSNFFKKLWETSFEWRSSVY